MNCPYCDGTGYAVVASGAAPCPGCAAGRKIAEARLKKQDARDKRRGIHREPPSADRFERVTDSLDERQKAMDWTNR